MPPTHKECSSFLLSCRAGSARVVTNAPVATSTPENSSGATIGSLKTSIGTAIGDVFREFGRQKTLAAASNNLRDRVFPAQQVNLRPFQRSAQARHDRGQVFWHILDHNGAQWIDRLGRKIAQKTQLHLESIGLGPRGADLIRALMVDSTTLASRQLRKHLPLDQRWRTTFVELDAKQLGISGDYPDAAALSLNVGPAPNARGRKGFFDLPDTVYLEFSLKLGGP